ncbi:MAG: hypothetical protein IJ480_05740 [Clostridia bacterium]|nr:hypothetical protein [Clostridia bacterium]
MLSPKALVQLYSDLQACPQPHIRLPVRFFVGSLAEFFILLLLASACTYNILYLVSVFLWLYVPVLTILFSKIWDLYGLSVPRLYITVGLFYVLTIPAGPWIRQAFTELFSLL